MALDETSFPPCGYGLLGLCCSACLLGPCRISPFDQGSGAGRCGDDTDRMVAGGLRRLAAAELLESMGRLAEAVEGLSESGTQPRDETAQSGRRRQVLEDKYGYPDGLSQEAFTRHLLRTVEPLLSPLARGPQSLLIRLFPEKTFPFLHGGSLFEGSPARALFHSSAPGSGNDPGSGEIFRETLSLAATALLCEELARDLSGLTGGTNEKEEGDLAAAFGASAGRSTLPVVFLQSKEEDSLLRRFPDFPGKVEHVLRKKVFPLILVGPGRLPGAARALFKKGPGSCRALAFVSSPRVTWALGALALGFSVVSCPALPIHGSEGAERFFLKKLREERGQVYLAFREDEPLSGLLDGLKGVP